MSFAFSAQQENSNLLSLCSFRRSNYDSPRNTGSLRAIGLMNLAVGQTSTENKQARLRIAIVGLVHGHVHGFLDQFRNNPEIEIVGIAEPDQALLAQVAAKYGFDRGILFTDLESMLSKAKPQAAWAYTNTYDHRRVVETCARHGVHVMMEKPLAVNLDDAVAIEKAARNAKIHALVNYETSWYPSNHAAYDYVQQGALGEVRKVVIHDGHKGPKEIGVEPEFSRGLPIPSSMAPALSLILDVTARI